MTKIVILGAYGAGNIGDEAILAGIITGFRDACNNKLEFTVFSQSPLQTKRLHEVESLPLSRRSAILAKHLALQHADIVIVGGGGLFQNNRPGGLLTGTFGVSMAYLAWARVARSKAMALAVGIGPISGSIARACAALTLSSARQITVRDKYSQDYALSLGINPAQTIVTADPAYVLSPGHLDMNAAPAQQEVRIGISLRPVWLRSADNSSWEIGLPAPILKNLASAVDSFVAKFGAMIDFLPFDMIKDTRIFCELQKHSQYPERYHLLQLNSPTEILPAYRNLSLVIGMRLHSVIFSAIAGIPCVPLLYDQKVANAASLLGLVDLALDMNDLKDSSRIGSILEMAWSRRVSIMAMLRANANDQRTRSLQNFLIARNLFET